MLFKKLSVPLGITIAFCVIGLLYFRGTFKSDDRASGLPSGASFSWEPALTSSVDRAEFIGRLRITAVVRRIYSQEKRDGRPEFLEAAQDTLTDDPFRWPTKKVVDAAGKEALFPLTINPFTEYAATVETTLFGNLRPGDTIVIRVGGHAPTSQEIQTLQRSAGIHRVMPGDSRLYLLTRITGDASYGLVDGVYGEFDVTENGELAHTYNEQPRLQVDRQNVTVEAFNQLVSSRKRDSGTIAK